jgi:hypothetical protein
MLCFVAGSAEKDSGTCMSAFQAVFGKSSNEKDADLSLKALESWGLLASTISERDLSGQSLMNRVMPLFSDLLDHKSVEVRNAAGENIALVYSARAALEAERKETEQGDDADTAAESETVDNEEEEDDGETGEETPSKAKSKSKSKAKSAGKQGSAKAAKQEQKESQKQAKDVQKSANGDSEANGDAHEAGDVEDASADKKAGEKQAKQQQSGKKQAKSDSKSSPAKDKAGSSKQTDSSAGQSNAGAAESKSQTGDFDMDALADKLSNLATDTSHRKSKKDKAQQRSLFRDVLRTVEDGEEPHESLKIDNAKHEFSGWATILQLNAVRRILAEGLQLHFRRNDLLCEIFEVTPSSMDDEQPTDKASKRESQDVYKAKARENFQHIQKQRTKKNAFQHAED